ncbi:MAG: hypothetical protein CL917_09295 [Deltaproteobacteria bacterium]|nr:hypothetical protein [Deltaproteobacteria bacterium]
MRARLWPTMNQPTQSPDILLENSLQSGRIHSAYLVSGAGETPLETAVRFARGTVCQADPQHTRPCERCSACRRSTPAEDPLPLIAKPAEGPRFRQIGDHPDLYWIEIPEKKTRVLIEQVRELQKALQLGSHEGGWRTAIIADAAWLHPSAENALLRLLEEPPANTSILLVAPIATTLLPTIRSRCVRVAYPAEHSRPLRGEDVDEEVENLVERLDGITKLGMSGLMDWAEEYQGARAEAAESVDLMLSVAGDWIREKIHEQADEGHITSVERLDAYKTLLNCRRELVRRNANPRMTAERGLFALRASMSQ